MTPEQEQELFELRRDGVLRDLHSASQIDRTDRIPGIVLVSCGDGTRFHEMMNHHYGVQRCEIHPLSLNGGGVLLDPDFPRNHHAENRRDQILIDDIDEAFTKKGYSVVALGIHFPCAVLTRYEIGVDRGIRHLLRARSVLRDKLPAMSIYTFLHAHFSPEREKNQMLTYRINHKHPRFAPETVAMAGP